MQKIGIRGLIKAIGKKARLVYNRNDPENGLGSLGILDLDENGFFLRVFELNDWSKFRDELRINGGEEIVYETKSGQIRGYEIGLNDFNPQILLRRLRDKYPLSRKAFRKEAQKTKIKRVYDAINNGVSSLEEVCLRAEIGIFDLRRLCQKGSVILPETLKPLRYRSDLDFGIDNGLGTGEIGRKVGISRQAVFRYIIASGQYDNWIKNKIARKKTT